MGERVHALRWRERQSMRAIGEQIDAPEVLRTRFEGSGA